MFPAGNVQVHPSPPDDDGVRESRRTQVANAAGAAGWKVVGGLSAALAGKATREVVDKAYTRATGKEPPVDPTHPGLQIREAIIWAIVSGISVALVRLAVERGAASAWVRVTGSLPPGLDELES